LEGYYTKSREQVKWSRKSVWHMVAAYLSSAYLGLKLKVRDFMRQMLRAARRAKSHFVQILLFDPGKILG
jgi:hypothetical protein